MLAYISGFFCVLVTIIGICFVFICSYLNDWQKQGHLEQDDLNTLFGNIEEVYDFNVILLGELEQSGSEPFKIAECFIKLQDEFDAYTQYWWVILDYYMVFCLHVDAWTSCHIAYTHSEGKPTKSQAQHTNYFPSHCYVIRNVIDTYTFSLTLFYCCYSIIFVAEKMSHIHTKTRDIFFLNFGLTKKPNKITTKKIDWKFSIIEFMTTQQQQQNIECRFDLWISTKTLTLLVFSSVPLFGQITFNQIPIHYSFDIFTLI